MKSPEHTVFADEFANIFSKFLTVCEGIATPMVHVISCIVVSIWMFITKQVSRLLTGSQLRYFTAKVMWSAAVTSSHIILCK